MAAKKKGKKKFGVDFTVSRVTVREEFQVPWIPQFLSFWPRKFYKEITFRLAEVPVDGTFSVFPCEWDFKWELGKPESGPSSKRRRFTAYNVWAGEVIGVRYERELYEHEKWRELYEHEK